MAKYKNQWRGVVRGNLRVGKRVANSMIRYHERHDPGAEPQDVFLDDADLATVVAFLDLCTEKMNETKLS